MSKLHLGGLLVLIAIAGGCASPRIAQTTFAQDPPPRTQDPGTRTTETTRTTDTTRTTTDTRRATTTRDTRDRDERRDIPWEVTVAGTGTNDEKFNVGGGQLSGSVGYYFNEVVELLVRHSTSYSDDQGSLTGQSDDDVWNFQTRLALDFHLPLGNVVPYVGGNVGYLYGDTDALDDTFALGPEAGVKIYLQRAAFLQIGAEWEFFTDRDSTLDDTFEDGQLFYFAGLGLRF